MNKKLGQLFICGVSGLSLTEQERDFLKSSNLGGVILFSNNYDSPAQLAELTNEIQECRSDSPFFIAVDQEGGRVQRFKNGFTLIPSMTDLGLLNSPTTCFELFARIGKELKTCGVNLNFAPVCDIHSNPKNKVIGDRSFGTTEEIVSKLVTPAIRAFQKESVIACAKHFPGHGDTLRDSHFQLPLIKKSWDEIEKFELLPFIKACKSGVDMMMMAHLQVDCLDENYPTTLSENAYKVLRDSLKYDGVIVSDDMEMKAISDHYPYDQAGFQAIKCGADIVEYRSMETCKEALEGAIKALDQNELSSQRVEEAFSRVKALKDKYLSNYQPIYVPNIAENMNQEEHSLFIQDLVDKISQVKE